MGEQMNTAKVGKYIKELQAKIEEMEDEVKHENQGRAKAEQAKKKLEKEYNDIADRLDEAGGATYAQAELYKKREVEWFKSKRDIEESTIQHEASVAAFKRSIMMQLQKWQIKLITSLSLSRRLIKIRQSYTMTQKKLKVQWMLLPMIKQQQRKSLKMFKLILLSSRLNGMNPNDALVTMILLRRSTLLKTLNFCANMKKHMLSIISCIKSHKLWELSWRMSRSLLMMITRTEQLY